MKKKSISPRLTASRAVRLSSSDPIQAEEDKEQAQKDGYQSPYADRIASLTTQVADDAKTRFTYRPETDPAYAATRKTYEKEAARTTEDTLGNYAAMTGGLPSTTAVNAATQAGGAVMDKFAGQIPELYQLAYEMASEEKESRADALSSLLAADKNAYTQYTGQASLSQVLETDALQKVYDFASVVKADFDDYGKIVSGSKRAKILNYIDSLDLENSQKDDLYLAYGYQKSKIGQTPWNKS